MSAELPLQAIAENCVKLKNSTRNDHFTVRSALIANSRRLKLKCDVVDMSFRKKMYLVSACADQSSRTRNFQVDEGKGVER